MALGGGGDFTAGVTLTIWARPSPVWFLQASLRIASLSPSNGPGEFALVPVC